VEIEQTKTCPLCAETINAAAKVCPHCRHWQMRWSFQNPQIVGSLWGILGLCVWLTLLAYLNKIFGPKRDFAEYPDQIAVVSSQFSHRTVGSNLMVTVVGVLTNRSNCSWEDVGFETRFFDRDGKLIDAVVQTGDFQRFAILKHSEEAFRVEGRATRPPEAYASHKVTVRWAKDADAWP
jgi:hypothetical protein